MIPPDWDDWLEETLHSETDARPIGLKRAFSVAEARDAGATIDELADFIVRSLRTYSLAAHRLKIANAMFYSWLDEQSGHLCLGTASARSASELPFRCILEPCDDPRVIASLALTSPYLDGIPWSELEEVEWSDPKTDNEPFHLPIFVRAVVRLS